jgi:hypothetical protein
MNEVTAGVVLSMATMVVLAGCSAAPAPSATPTATPKPTHTAIVTSTVKGTITVTDKDNIFASSQGAMPCSPIKNTDYSDIQTGAEVDVVDASGKVLAFAQLDPGSTPGFKALGQSCAFPFTITNVPHGEMVYGVQIGHQPITHYAEKDFFSSTLDVGYGAAR